MNKSRLQELCHRNRWNPPEYATAQDGPPHSPTFTAAVSVAGLSFSSGPSARSSKEAQNNAAGLAILHFTGPKSPPIAPTETSTVSGIVNHIPATERKLQVEIQETCQTPEDKQHLYKTKLQNYAQKGNLPLPMYSFESTGPSHNARFKSKVTIEGQTYECPDFCLTLKDAEHAAAKVAFMSLSPAGVQEDDCGVYKNLLQEMARKEGYQLPVYITEKFGASHIPEFLSTVEIRGESFFGQKAKTKKQAEMYAAKVAYNCLKERQSNQNNEFLAPSGQELKRVVSSSFKTESSRASDLQQNIISKCNEVLKPSGAEQTDDKGGSGQRPESPCTHLPVVKAVEFPPFCSPSSGVADWPQDVKPKYNLTLLNPSKVFAKLDGDREMEMDPDTRSSSSPQNGDSCHTTLPEKFMDLVPPAWREDSACTKVIVYPSKIQNPSPLPASVVQRPVGDEWLAAEFSSLGRDQ